MDSDSHFWLNWYMQATIAAAAVCSLLFVLLGAFRRFRNASRLRLQLADDIGILTGCCLTKNNGEPVETRERWYHLKVSNRTRAPLVTQVQCYITQVDEINPAGKLQNLWSGEVPVHWQGQCTAPAYRDIGHPVNIDLFSIVEDYSLRIHPVTKPRGLECEWRRGAHLLVTIQARGIEAESKPVRIQIDWDGQWDDSDAQMRRHVVVQALGKR